MIDNSQECEFCRIYYKDDPVTVYVSSDAVVALDKHPFTQGHLLIIPREHTPEFYMMDQEKYLSVMLLVKKMSNVVNTLFKPVKVGVFILGFEIPHTHIHIVPLHDHYYIDQSHRRTSNDNMLAQSKNLQEVASIIKEEATRWHERL